MSEAVNPDLGETIVETFAPTAERENADPLVMYVVTTNEAAPAPLGRRIRVRVDIAVATLGARHVDRGPVRPVLAGVGHAPVAIADVTNVLSSDRCDRARSAHLLVSLLPVSVLRVKRKRALKGG